MILRSISVFLEPVSDEEMSSKEMLGVALTLSVIVISTPLAWFFVCGGGGMAFV